MNIEITEKYEICIRRNMEFHRVLNSVKNVDLDEEGGW